VGDKADPHDVDVAILFREAEPLRQVFPDDVAVQDLHFVTHSEQLGLQDLGDRRFACPR
jgi:hypothetical protein